MTQQTTGKQTDGRARSGRSGVAEEAMLLDRQLCFALYSASANMTRLYRPLLEPLGLTYPQYLVMLVLWEKAPRTVGELGAALGLDSATVTPLLKRMEASGLVERRRDPADERRVMVGPSATGAALRQTARTVPEQLLCRLPIPREEVFALREALKRLNDGLRDSAQPEST